MRRTLSILVLSVLALAGSACKGDHVTLNTWCTSLGSAYCGKCSPGGAATQQCIQAFTPACLNNRDPNMVTDRTQNDATQCAAAIQGGDCNTMMAGAMPPVCLIH